MLKLTSQCPKYGVDVVHLVRNSCWSNSEQCWDVVAWPCVLSGRGRAVWRSQCLLQCQGGPLSSLPTHVFDIHSAGVCVRVCVDRVHDLSKIWPSVIVCHQLDTLPPAAVRHAAECVHCFALEWHLTGVIAGDAATSHQKLQLCARLEISH